MSEKTDRGKLGNFLREIINWTWDEFCEAENDQNYTGYEAAVFSLVRTCSEGKLGAIRLAIDRIDGKVETPIKVDYPKFYILFPDAEKVALKPGTEDLNRPTSITANLEVDKESTQEEEEQEEEKKEDAVKAATLTLRETLKEMADHPRVLTQLILDRKEKVESGNIEDHKNIPLVKSVIAANLLSLAENNNFEAIMEVFDQIDGKLVETIKIIGEDIYMSNHALEAPYGAKKNEDGIYQIEMPQATNVWKEKLDTRHGR